MADKPLDKGIATAKTVVDSKKKSHFTLGKLIAAGLISHVGANAAIKGLKHISKYNPSNKLLRKATQIYPNFERKQFSRGVRRGISGDTKTVRERLGATWIGPEMYAANELGAQVGRSLKGLDPARRTALLQNLSREVKATKGLEHTPVFEMLPGGIDRTLRKGHHLAKPVEVSRGKEWLRKGLHGIGSAGLIAAEPGAAVHGAINLGRGFAAKSRTGGKFMKNEFKRGALSSVGLGKARSKPAQHAMDIIMSPAAADPSRVAQGLVSAARQNPRQLLRTGKAVGDIAIHHPDVRRRAGEYVGNTLGSLFGAGKQAA